LARSVSIEPSDSRLEPLSLPFDKRLAPLARSVRRTTSRAVLRAALGVFGAAAAPHVPARVEIGSCASMARVPDADPRTVRQRVELAEAHDRCLGHRPVPRAEDVEERVLDGDAVARRELVAGGARELVRRGGEGALDGRRCSHCVLCMSAAAAMACAGRGY
jgi:hypothetical protein